MSYLFDAPNADVEDAIKNAVDKTIEALREETGQDTLTLAFSGEVAIIVARLIDIGVAPQAASLTSEIRDRVHRFGSVRIDMRSDRAKTIAKHLEIGLMRHQAGVNDPAKFTLH